LGDLEALQARVTELEAELAQARESAREHALTRSRLDAIMSALPIVVWEVSAEGVVTMTEGHGLTYMGMRPNQTVGSSVYEMYEDRPEVREHMVRGLAGEAFSVVNEIAGTRFENHYFPRSDADGTPNGLLGLTWIVNLHEDVVAKRLRAEQQVQHDQKQESLAVLAGGIAHDFNNLLVGSLGHADLALGLVAEHSVLAGHLREIVRSSERAAELCSQLLAYAGRGRFLVKTIDLNRLVEDSMRLIALTIAKTSVLDAELAPDIPPFRGDATQVVQVLINLLKNASDAAEGKPSTIRIRSGLQHVEPDERRLTVVGPDAKAGDYVFVSICDQGVGMRPEEVGRIFDPFYSTKQTGRGLGLAAVVGIVRGHGGMLEVESQLGVGTTMVVYLPACPLATPSTQPPARSQPAELTSATILVVDDEPVPRQVARTMLERNGCTVVEASNGREAVELYRANPASFRAVLMDLSMPVMDGATALRELRAIDANAKVILVSGYAEHDTTRELAGLRPSALLLKPYRYEQLLAILASVQARR
jgi:two-component system cell cycle sensor histidine kinase/response regulator CckA